MKTLHYLDVFFQTVILLLTAASFLAEPNFMSLLLIYIGLGIWQPLFTLIFSFGHHKITPARKIYNMVLLIMLVLGTPFLFKPGNSGFGDSIGDLILLVSPFIALYNYGLGIYELRLLTKAHTVWDIE